MAKPLKLSGTKSHTRYKAKDGKTVPGTTTILGVLAKPYLIQWANKMGLQGIDTTKYVDALARIGTLAHYLVECHIRGIEPDLSTYSQEEINLAENSFLSFLEWEKGKDIQYLDNEIQLVSEQYKYGGTIDCYAVINGKHNLIDFKTSRQIYSEHIIQLSAYKQLLEENGFPVDEVRILRIGRSEDDGFDEKVVKDVSNHWKLFLSLLDVYKYHKIINRKDAV